jgi:NAD-specific glutamate dehydrogenase
MLVKDELLDKVLVRVREQLSEDQAPQVEEFVRQYFAWIPAEDLADRSPIDVYGAAVAHWSFARQREPGTSKVRVYNPNFEEHSWQSTHTVLEIVTDDMSFLVDSTRMGVNRQGYAIHLMLHPIMRVRRDDEGRLVAGASVKRQLERYDGEGLPETFSVYGLHPERAELLVFTHEERGLIGTLSTTWSSDHVRVAQHRLCPLFG